MAILLPKVDGPGAIMLAARALSDARAPEKTRLWAMMETPMAMLSAGSIAATAADPTARLEVLVMGLNDLAKETRARLTPGRAAFTHLARDSASRRRARTAATSSTASTTTSETSTAFATNASRAANWASTARR